MNMPEVLSEDYPSSVEGDWGKWPYLDKLPPFDRLPEGVDPLIITDNGDINHFDPFGKLPDPRNLPTMFLYGVPVLIGHLACDASGLLICRQDEYGELIRRINGFTRNTDNLLWVKAMLELSANLTLNEIEKLKLVSPGGSPKVVPPGKGEVLKKLQQKLQPTNPHQKLSGLKIGLERILHYINAINSRMEEGGFSVGLVAERYQPMRPGKPMGHFERHITVHSHIINRRAGNTSVPRWN